MSGSQDKITLYRGFANSNTYVWSAFVAKVEFRFRYAKLPYRIDPGSTAEAPNGKVPYIDMSALNNNAATSESGSNLLGDSAIIISTLVQKGHLEDLNAALTPTQKATDLALRAMFEDKLYFFGMCERWIDNYYIQRDEVLHAKPLVLKILIGNIIHRKIVQTVHLQGCGRFTSEEQKAFRHEIWETLEAMLAEQRKMAEGNEPFWCLGGQKPTEADSVVFAFICTTLVARSAVESTKFVRTLPAVMDYANRIHCSLFPDYEKWEE